VVLPERSTAAPEQPLEEVVEARPLHLLEVREVHHLAAPQPRVAGRVLDPCGPIARRGLPLRPGPARPLRVEPPREGDLPELVVPRPPLLVAQYLVRRHDLLEPLRRPRPPRVQIGVEAPG